MGRSPDAFRIPLEATVTPEIEKLKSQLHHHPLYAEIHTPDDLRTFMEHHVAAVWDFMSLLKSLQMDLTSTGAPWVPTEDPEAARLVNEIVLGEETDEIAPGRHVSHFEWYVGAMDDVGAHSGPIRELVEHVRDGEPPRVALARSRLPVAAAAFTAVTLRVLDEPLHVRAAVFLHSREDVIPRMFVGIVEHLQRGGLRCGALLAYLERHIDVDTGRHAPMAAALLDRLHQGDPHAERESAVAVRTALEARKALWDAVLEEIRTAPVLQATR
jgi:hypothetical protein